MAEHVAGRRQPARDDPLARLDDFAGALGAQEQAGPNGGTVNEGGAPQDPGERGGVVRLVTGSGRHRVERPVQLVVRQGAPEDVEQVVEADPRDPLRSGRERTAEAGREQGAEELQAGPAGGLHDAGPHVDDPHAGRGGGLRRRLPVLDELGQEARSPARCPR